MTIADGILMLGIGITGALLTILIPIVIHHWDDFFGGGQ